MNADALLALPLFAELDEGLADAIRFEAGLSAGTESLPDGVPPRAGYVRFASIDAGEVLQSQGELATELVVVLSGRVEARQVRAGHEPFVHREYGPGDWFGETTTHSHHPALATCTAVAAATIAALDARLLAKLYAEDEAFRERVDAGYRANLPLHLRACSLCRDLDDRALAELEAVAELRTVDEGGVVAAAGEAADSVFVVRAGAVACYADPERTDRALAFYKSNATFGEHVVTTAEPKWPGTYRALTRTALVVLPRRALDRLAVAARQGLARAANRIVGTADVEAAAGGDAPQLGARRLLDELFVMVERESVKGGRALVIDRGKCVRCNMCVESCVAVHDDGIPRLSKVGTPVVTDEVLVTACYHCEVPQCMLSCDYGAIRRDAQGRVRFEYDNCVGCAGCIDGCPYGVIRLVPPASGPPPRKPWSFLESLPLVGALFSAKPPDAALAAAGEKPRAPSIGGDLTPVSGKTVKCDLCAGLPFEACVYNCPTAAITRRQPQSLFDARRSDG